LATSQNTSRGGTQSPLCRRVFNFELLKKIKALREVRLRAENVDFSFMKRMVQPLMARDTLG
jgi:hypothetical protein